MLDTLQAVYIVVACIGLAILYGYLLSYPDQLHGEEDEHGTA